jgi:hypothetical protein
VSNINGYIFWDQDVIIDKNLEITGTFSGYSVPCAGKMNAEVSYMKPCKGA